MQITFPKFDHRELILLQECLDSKWVTQGPFVSQFERLMEEKHQVKKALATTSCTAALHIAMLALGLGPDDEVLVPAFTWVTSAHAAEYVGAKAVFVDVDPKTFNIDVALLESKITKKTKAIVAVHLFGLAADMDPILALAKQYNLAVIEDAACAVGTLYKGTPIGGLGDMGCFSFHPRKLITTGEGGMLTTNAEELVPTMNAYRNHGAFPAEPSDEPMGPWTMSRHEVLGHNLRLSDIQAAVGVAQFEKLESLLADRRKAAEYYSLRLDELNQVIPPSRDVDVSGHNFQSYVIRVDGTRALRNHVMRVLMDEDIHTRPGTHAVHRLGYYQKKYDLNSNDFPMAVLCENTTITLPLFPGMTHADQDKVVDVIQKALN